MFYIKTVFNFKLNQNHQNWFKWSEKINAVKLTSIKRQFVDYQNSGSQSIAVS